MSSQATTRLCQKNIYGAVSNKNIRAVLRKELLTNFGFEHMFLMADVLIERVLQIVKEADVIVGHLEPFQTVVYGYDKHKKFLFARRPYQLDLRAARVHIITSEEIAQLTHGASLTRLRSEIAVRILKEAYDQDVILSFADVGLVMCQSPARISQLVRDYRQSHPGEFIPQCRTFGRIAGRCWIWGGTITHKREAILLYLQGHLTSEIARKIQHNPEDVDRYIYDYQRVVELAQEHRTVAQISFLTNLRQHLVRQHIALWKVFDSMRSQEAEYQVET